MLINRLLSNELTWSEEMLEKLMLAIPAPF